MKKLNTIFSFVLLSFCLLINVSIAEFSETTSVPECIFTTGTVIDSSTQFGNYSLTDIKTLVTNYNSGGYEDSSFADDYNVMLDTLKANGYYFFNYCDNYSSFILGTWSDTGVKIQTNGTYKGLYFYFDIDAWYIYPAGSRFYNKTSTSAGYFLIQLQVYDDNEHVQLNCPCKVLDRTTGLWTSEYLISYPPNTDESDTPSLPSNAEIAQTVQAFYNSDYYKNNKDFKDFIVLLNTKTNAISFIGHNFSEYLSQQIVPANYEFDGEKYSQDWWRFYLRSITDQIKATLFERYYWLYSTIDLGETITYDGKGYMNDLLNLRFTTQSVIIYSTADYYVQTFEKDDEGVYWPETGTIPGDQYTYDETLDPTENQYNPFDTFVPTNPSQNILGNVDFNEINKTFEENKNILNIENASWLFTANNKLVSYFVGFLSFLIVLIIISRLLGG